MPSKNITDEFGGFLANPQARKRGSRATRALRGHQTRGLLERMAQAEVNRRLRVELARRACPEPLDWARDVSVDGSA
jgi:hypothetical protein